MSDILKRGKYTLEFKEESIRQVLAGASIGSVASSLGIPKGSLGNWVRQHQRGQLGGQSPVSATPVSADQVSI